MGPAKEFCCVPYIIADPVVGKMLYPIIFVCGQAAKIIGINDLWQKKWLYFYHS